jgi:hypothetical protein
MKQRSLLVLSFIAILFASCGNKAGKSGLMVPKDAAIVVHINSASLSSKLSWSEIKATSWFKKMQGEVKSDDTLAQRLLNDPSKSGIDTKQDFVMYIKKHGRGGYMVVEGSLTDKATYEQMLAEMHKKEPKEIKKHGDFSYVSSKNETSVVVWNKTMFAIVSNANIPNMGANLMGGKKRSEGFEFEADSLQIFGEQALTLEGGQNLDSDSRFANLIKDGSDMHVWMNIGSYMSGAGNPMLNMTKASTIFEGNITAMSLNFENGKITAKSKHYFNDQMAKIHSDNKPENVSADVINRIPSSDVVAVLAFNYSPQAFKEVLKVTGLDTYADMFLGKVDFSIDDFVKANKGEMLLAVCDPVAKMDTMKMGNEVHAYPGRPDAKILFATSVKDKASFEKMVTLLWDLSKQIRKGDDNSSIPGISYKLENNWFAVSNSAEYTDKFLAGGKNKFAFTDKITGHPMGLYIDLQRIIKFAGSMSKESTANKAIYDASLNMWQDITAKGGDYKDKSSESEFEINLVDKNTNSLKQLNQYFDKIGELMHEKMKMKERVVKDEEVKDPPPPAPK